MQSMSNGWINKVTQGKRRIGYGLLVSFLRTTVSGVNFFTIGQSRIGGRDVLKSSNSIVTYFEKYQMDLYSQFVNSFSVKRNLGQFPYGTLMAEADIELDNTTKKFLPGFDTTIASGILPNRPLKLSLSIEDESLKLFSGFTSQPVNTLVERKTQIHAFDVFDYINNFETTASGIYVNAPAHNIVASGMAEMGFTPSQYVLDRSLQSNIGFLATDGRLWGDIFRDICESEQAIMMADETGIVRFWNRQHFLTASGIIQFQHSYSSVKNLEWQSTPIINDVIVTAKPRESTPNTTLYTLQSSQELDAGETLELFVDFTDPNTNDPTIAITVGIPVYSATPLATSYYSVNTASDGSGSASADVVLLGAYSFGDRYRLTFRNNNSSASRYITALLVVGTAALVAETIEERAQDATSIDLYGRNPANNGKPLEIANDMIQTRSDAATLGYYLVSQYKTPNRRYIVPVARGSDPAIQIGDIGLLRIQDTGENKLVYTVGKTDILNRNADYQQILEVEERPFINNYFTIGQSRIGGPDVIAP